MDTYYVELVQTDPEGSPTPGLGHYAGEVTGFATATAALEDGICRLGKPPALDTYWPCCDWQQQTTPITSVIVYAERDESNPIIQAHWRPKEA